MAEINLPDGFGDNSFKTKEEKDKRKEAIKKATLTIAEPKKKTLYEKFANVFFSGSFKDMGSYVKSFLITQAKVAFLEGIRILVNGNGNSSGSPGSYYYDQASYNYDYSKNYYTGSAAPSKAQKRPEIFDPRRIIISDLQTAEMILKDVRDRIRTDGSCSINDFFNFARRRTISPDGKSEIPVPDWATTDYGWRNIDGARPVAAPKGGYFFSLPDPYYISY